jgi:hypothetical protein
VSAATHTDLVDSSETTSNPEEDVDGANAESSRQPIAKSGTSVVGYLSAISLLLIVNGVFLFSDLRCNLPPDPEDLSDADSN